MPTLIRPATPAPLATCRECKGRVTELKLGGWVHIRYDDATHPVAT